MPLDSFTRRFLLVKPSPRALKLARRSWLGPIQCYYPDNFTPTWKKKPWATEFIRQPLQIPQGPNIYRVARDYADAILDELNTILPGFFQIDEWNFRFVFRFNLQFHLAYQGLPLLYSTLMEQNSYKSTLSLIDNHLSPNLVNQFAVATGINLPTSSIRCLSTLHPVRLTRKLSQWRQQALQNKHESVSGGTLAVIPHTEHLDLLEPMLSVLGEQDTIRLLALHPKVNILAEHLPGAAVHQLSSLCVNRHLDNAIFHFQKLRTSVQRLPKDQQHFCYTQIDLLSDLVEKFFAFETTIKRLQPDTIIGCLEFNLYGAFLSMLRERSNTFRLINLQHGIVGPTWTVDGLYFDDYFLWNEQTAKSLQQSGYPAHHRIQVIGNPKWEILAQNVASETTSESYATLMAWKEDSPLIGAYTQCLQGYSTVQAKYDYLSSLIGYLQHNPQAKLLIKRHPLETDDVVNTIVQSSGCEDRIHVCVSEQLPLWETLKAVDIVTSVFSATLYEGLYLQKPTLALDFNKVIETQEVPWPQTGLTITEPQLVNATLDHWLAMGHANLELVTTSEMASIVPRFDIPYALRFRQLLKANITIPASSS